MTHTKNKNQKICLLDYGSGNVKSVFNMLKFLDLNVTLSNSKDQILTATHLILPGVGAFGASMRKIHQLLPLETLETAIFEKKVPFLGICVGMQVLADEGEEFGKHQGLGWINGKVRKIKETNLPLPHVGWNTVKITKKNSLLNKDNVLDFYFVHSYCFEPVGANTILGTCAYGEDFVSMIGQNNIYGVQFHPEKSQQAGMQLLTNFVSL